MVPRVVISLELTLSVILTAWIVKPARVVDVDRAGVAWVGVVTGIEIQVPSPTASAV